MKEKSRIALLIGALAFGVVGCVTTFPNREGGTDSEAGTCESAGDGGRILVGASIPTELLRRC